MSATQLLPGPAHHQPIGTIAERRRVQELIAGSLVLATGAALAVMGGVALLRALPIQALTGPHVTVGWLHHTPALAILHIVLAVTLVAVASYGRGEHLFGTGTFVGAIAGVFGAMIIIEPDALHASLATHTAHGLTYLFVGAASILYDAFTR